MLRIYGSFFADLHGRSIKVPGCMTEDRQHDEQTEKGREHGRHSERPDDEAEAEHGSRVLDDGAHACDHRGHEIDLVVQQQRHGDDGDREEEGGEHAADDRADAEKEDALRGGDDGQDQRIELRRLLVAEEVREE